LKEKDWVDDEKSWNWPSMPRQVMCSW
jgi:hypothetical protein